jgi:hypothetical protein
MSVLATIGIVVGLTVIALMALAPALVDLNERFPVRERDESRAEGAERSGRPLDLRWSDKDPTFGLN